MSHSFIPICSYTLREAKGAFILEECFHSSYNYRWKYLLFGVFAPQELLTILVIEMPFVGTKLAPILE